MLLLIVTAARSFVQNFIYPMPPVAVGAPPPGHEEVFWRLEDGVEVHGWHGGDSSGPVAIFFHGNGENLGTLGMSGVFERFRELGVYSVAVDYPGYGKSGGRPSRESVVSAGLAAFDWAAAENPGRPLLVVGWSLGAAVATQVAAARPEAVAGLVTMSPWSRLSDVAAEHFPRWLVRLLLWEEYDSIAAAASIRCPVLVIHGEEDRIIPAAQGRRFAEAVGVRAVWVSLAGSGHNDLLGRPEVWVEMSSFLESHR